MRAALERVWDVRVSVCVLCSRINLSPVGLWPIAKKKKKTPQRRRRRATEAAAESCVRGSDATPKSSHFKFTLHFAATNSQVDLTGFM